MIPVKCPECNFEREVENNITIPTCPVCILKMERIFNIDERRLIKNEDI